jgi:membrane protein
MAQAATYTGASAVLRAFWHKVTTVFGNWSEHKTTELSAALAYYSLFSIAPLLIIGIAVAGQLFGEAAARGEVVKQIRQYVGDDSAEAVQTMLANFRKNPTTPWAAIGGIAMLLYGGMNIFTQVRASLNRIWGAPTQTQTFWLSMIKDYLLAGAMLLVTCAFLLVLIGASTALPILRNYLGASSGRAWFWRGIDFAVSTFLLMQLFAFAYRFMSDCKVRYRDVWGGALITAILFTPGKMALGIYVGYSGMASGYGVAGSLVVFLVWVYYSSMIFFLGAEIVRLRIAGDGARR